MSHVPLDRLQSPLSWRVNARLRRALAGESALACRSLVMFVEGEVLERILGTIIVHLRHLADKRAA
jgi:hypothetical protein